MAEVCLMRGAIQHFLGQPEKAKADWDRATRLVPQLDVAEHVSQLLGQWVMMDSWTAMPRAQKLRAVQEGSNAVVSGQFEVALSHFEQALGLEAATGAETAVGAGASAQVGTDSDRSPRSPTIVKPFPFATYPICTS